MTLDTLTMEALRVATSHFCKARGVFRGACFETKPIGPDGETASVLKKPPSGDYGADQLYHLLEYGVAECLDRDCLRSISLCIVRNHDNALLEELTLDCEATRGSDHSPTSLSDAIRELTRKHRLLVQTLSPLPEDSAFKVRLTLIGAKMPYRAWTPPFFLCLAEPQKPSPQQFDGKPVTLKIGKFSSDGERCSLSIRSVLDTMEALTSSGASQSEPPQIAFDAVFTQLPTDATEEAVDQGDVDLYQTIKTFVASDKTPSMKRTHEAHRHVTMPSIRTFFHKLCDEGVLVRRGNRFYMAKQPATGPQCPQRKACTPSANPLGCKGVERAEPVALPPTHRVPAIAQLIQAYKAAQHKKTRNVVPPSPILSKPEGEATRNVNAHSSVRHPRAQGEKISTKRFGRMVTAPIIQTTRPPHSIQDSCPKKFGRPVFIAANAIIQAPRRAVRRRQKIAILGSKV